MVKITNKSQEFSNLEVYNMTKSHKLNTLKNLENGEKLEVAGFMEWEDANEETGEATKVTAIYETDSLEELAKKYQSLLASYTTTEIKVVEDLDIDMIVNISDN